MVPVIEVQGLMKTFNKKNILSGLNFTVPQGAMVALIGASGSGKSTLLRHLAGLTESDRQGGKVTALGQAVQKEGVLSSPLRHTSCPLI